MSEKSIIIIGAGIAGLSAGCYGQKNGYKVHIFEQDTRPGGLCTSWERKGYTINGGLAFLLGSGEGTDFFNLWKELGVVPKLHMIDYEYFIIVEGKSGQTFYMHNNLDRLEAHMKELAPEDIDVIEDFIQGARIFTRYSMPMDKAPELLTAIDKMKFLFTRFPLIKTLGKWKKVTFRDFTNRFKNPFLREAFYQAKSLFSDDAPILLFQMALAAGHVNSCGYPEGGALKLSQTIEDYFVGLGGIVDYKSKVEKILIENDCAKGVRLKDGSEHFADYVISAADGRTTIFEMLDGKFIDTKIRKFYDSLPVAPPPLLTAFGVNRTFDDLPHSAAGTIFPLDQPVTLAGQELTSLRPMIYNYDKTLAPEGKTCIRVVLTSDFDYWKSLHQDSEKYKAEKENIAQTMISILDKRYPGLSAKVEMWDVSTPVTFARYTGNWRGSMIGWDCTVDTFFMPMSKTLAGLHNFFMAGQWVEPGGGIPMVALSGRNVIQLITKRDKKSWEQ